MEHATASPPTTAAIRQFSELSRADVPFAGGKGANLGELMAAGLPVPPGFVVGAPAYAAFVDQTGLRARIAEHLSGVDVDDACGGELRACDAVLVTCVAASSRGLPRRATRQRRPVSRLHS